MTAILLHPDDNVLVLSADIAVGGVVIVDGVPIASRAAVQAGHKIARRAVASGSKIVKYGAPIGSAVSDIAAGDHVHLHNMKSDYIASHTRNATGRAAA
jgi:hypothetical protein